jgi:hypothetical protein
MKYLKDKFIKIGIAVLLRIASCLCFLILSLILPVAAVLAAAVCLFNPFWIFSEYLTEKIGIYGKL